jgi:ribose transport system ATP-binding protein
MLTEDRKESGLLMPMSIAGNTSLTSLALRFSRRGIICHNAEVQESERMCQFLDTQCTNVNQVVGTLSGGNQQKVAVAKWLVRDCRVFLMDEPTRGIDVAARRRVYRLIDSMAQQGRALVIVSSEVEELMQICDRIVVLSVGQLVAEFPRAQWSHEKIMQACFWNHRREKEVQRV